MKTFLIGLMGWYAVAYFIQPETILAMVLVSAISIPLSIFISLMKD